MNAALEILSFPLVGGTRAKVEVHLLGSTLFYFICKKILGGWGGGVGGIQNEKATSDSFRKQHSVWTQPDVHRSDTWWSPQRRILAPRLMQGSSLRSLTVIRLALMQTCRQIPFSVIKSSVKSGGDHERSSVLQMKLKKQVWLVLKAAQHLQWIWNHSTF